MHLYCDTKNRDTWSNKVMRDCYLTVLSVSRKQFLGSWKICKISTKVIRWTESLRMPAVWGKKNIRCKFFYTDRFSKWSFFVSSADLREVCRGILSVGAKLVDLTLWIEFSPSIFSFTARISQTAPSLWARKVAFTRSIKSALSTKDILVNSRFCQYKAEDVESFHFFISAICNVVKMASESVQFL